MPDGQRPSMLSSTPVNLNDKTPITERHKTWISGVFHGDFGRTRDQLGAVKINQAVGHQLVVHSGRTLLVCPEQSRFRRTPRLVCRAWSR